MDKDLLVIDFHFNMLLDIDVFRTIPEWTNNAKVNMFVSRYGMMGP